MDVDDLNPKRHTLSNEVRDNLALMANKLNELERHGIYEFIPTSGYRTLEEQMVINPKALHSKHLIGMAIDILDEDGKVFDWVKEEENLLEKLGLWIEVPYTDPGHLHFQGLPPKSGKRFFYP